jgi:tRNA(fMet)-specific endonuclease VapC
MGGLYNLKEKFRTVFASNIYISEITLAELKFGLEKSLNKQKNTVALENFLTGVQILPITNSIDLYAKEKVRLQKAGTPVYDFDLLIAVTSVIHNMVMVTNNTRHFKNVSSILLEDWTIATPQ